VAFSLNVNTSAYGRTEVFTYKLVSGVFLFLK